MTASAREVALRVLLEVETGAFAANALTMQTVSLAGRDAGLASAITLGSLRYRSQLDFLIETLTRKPISKLDSAVREALRIGIFQLRYLERIPPHAAVSESVELVKQNGKRSAAGLVNAVLRKASSLEPIWPDRSVALSCPEWLLARWQQAFGAQAAEQIAAAALETPRHYARVPPDMPIPANAISTDVAGCFELASNTVLPAGSRWQDIGSQAIVPLLELEPSHRMLDLCAAPGNKTAQARETGAWTLACDISPKRLALVPAPRMVLDARAPLPFPCASFERILLDAPCSGTGTLAHNPEIKWRLTEAEILRHAERQRAMLQQALPLLKPGGLLVYSTCSLEMEENEHVVAAVAPERVVRTERRMPGRDAGDGFFAAVLR